jgi:hypothetical protein
MKQIYTNLRTLAKVKELLNELGLRGLIEKGEKMTINLMSILDKLIDGKKLVQFIQIITKDYETDWEEVELKDLKEVLTAFFTGIVELLPESIRNMMNLSIIPPVPTPIQTPISQEPEPIFFSI